MKKSLKLGIATLMTTQAASQVAMAQFEDFPPPPPPAMSNDLSQDMGEIPESGNSPTYNSNTRPDYSATIRGGVKNIKEKGLITKNQKEKFNKSGPEDITPENFPETLESFDFPNVEITDLIKAISELTGKNFIIDPGVRGKITIVAPSKLTLSEAYKAFLSALAINGFTVVPSGNFLKVKSARNAQRDSIETYSGAYYPNSDQMITRIIHLKHISAEQVNRDLRILPSKDGEMSVYTQTNSIILSDYGSNIDRVMKIINQLDVPGFEDQLEVVPVKYAKAKDLADLVDKILNKGEKSKGGAAGSFSAGVPRFSRTTSASNSGQGSNYFMAIPDDRTNTIIVVGSKSGIVRIKKLLAQLDFRIRPEDSGGVFVYYVKHGEAEKIAQTLTGVTKDAAPKATGPAMGGLLGGAGGAAAGGGSNEIFGGDVKINADKATNSLIITASKQDYEVVMNLLAKLDIPMDLVFVEGIIMEMSSGQGDSWKPAYYNFQSSNGMARQSFNSGIKAEEIMNPLGSSGTVLSFGGGKEVELTVGATKLKVPSLVGLINFLKRTTKANILSTPKIAALNNTEAEIEVGDKVVVGANSTTGTTGTTVATPIFEDATIKLNIKPVINLTSETIRMDIKQTIKQPSAGASTPKQFEDSTQPLATRSIKTNIVVNNGDTAVLGGLMKDRESEESYKIPLLGDLPILGWLFKSKVSTKEKVNMLVFLTPTIIRNPSDQKQILSKNLDERLNYIKSQGGRDPFGQKVDEILKRSTQVDPNNTDELKIKE